MLSGGGVALQRTRARACAGRSVSRKRRGEAIDARCARRRPARRPLRVAVGVRAGVLRGGACRSRARRWRSASTSSALPLADCRAGRPAGRDCARRPRCRPAPRTASAPSGRCGARRATGRAAATHRRAEQADHDLAIRERRVVVRDLAQARRVGRRAVRGENAVGDGVHRTDDDTAVQHRRMTCTQAPHSGDSPAIPGDMLVLVSRGAATIRRAQVNLRGWTRDDSNPPASPRRRSAGSTTRRGAIAPPIHTSTTFIRDPDNQYRSGRIYARDHNPAFDQAEAVLDGARRRARGALLFASGMAAATRGVPGAGAGRPCARAPGDVLVAAQLADELRDHWGCRSSCVDMTRSRPRFASAVRPGQTRLVWVETPANPAVDRSPTSPRLAAIAHAAGAQAGGRLDGGDAGPDAAAGRSAPTS